MTCAGSVWGGRGAAVWQGGLQARLVLRGATWGVVSSRLANGCAEAEKPATGKYRGRARKEGAFDATC
jgi:hypothetical protein